VPKLDIICYSPTDVYEETSTTLNRCVELIEKWPVSWLSITGLTVELGEQLERTFALHPLAIEDCLSMTQAPKVEDYDDHLFLVARTIEWEKEIETRQLSLFLKRHLLITVSPEGPHGLRPLEEVRLRIERHKPALLAGGADYLCYVILDTIVDSYFPELDRFGEVVGDIEDEAVERPSPRTAELIHSLKADMLKLRRSLMAQREALAVLARGEYPLFRKETRQYLRDAYDHMIQILDLLDTYRELTSSLLDVYISSISNQMNEVMKVLAIIATIMLPLSLIAGLYGMNFVVLPGSSLPEGFWWVIVGMAAVAAVMLFWFARKGWLKTAWRPTQKA